MKIPKHITIRGVKIKVIQVDGLSAAHPLCDGSLSPNSKQKFDGLYLNRRACIALERDMDPKYKEVVFFHELAHAVLTLSEIDHKHEAQVEILGDVLRDVVRGMK